MYISRVRTTRGAGLRRDDMKIKEITNQNRRDFHAVYVCEHCGHEEKGSGYDDANFHQNIIPAMKCKACGKSAAENYRPLATKYPEGMQI
jgi:transcription elongation factor Elf1